MEILTINWFAVFAAALVGFAIGFLWYGPIFGKKWGVLAGLTEREVKRSALPKIFVGAFIFQFIMAFCLAVFLYGSRETATEMSAVAGAFYGFLSGFGLVATALGVNAMFERKSWSYIFINGGFWIIVFTFMGLVLGAWQ